MVLFLEKIFSPIISHTYKNLGDMSVEVCVTAFVTLCILGTYLDVKYYVTKLKGLPLEVLYSRAQCGCPTVVLFTCSK